MNDLEKNFRQIIWDDWMKVHFQYKEVEYLRSLLYCIWTSLEIFISSQETIV